jgi:putative flippase GtrA
VVAELLEIHQAKAIGFVTGTIFIYVANRNLTFGAQIQARGSGKRFTILYTLTLQINISVNAFMLRVLSKLQNPVLGAFLKATGLSAAINFIGMKHFVFIRAKAAETS